MGWVRCTSNIHSIIDDTYNVATKSQMNNLFAIQSMAMLKNITFTGVPADVTDILVVWWEYGGNNMVVVFLQNNAQWNYNSNHQIPSDYAYMVKLTTIDYSIRNVAVSYQKSFNYAGQSNTDHPIASTYDILDGGNVYYSKNISLEDIKYTT